jgi:hypothetical protein
MGQVTADYLLTGLVAAGIIAPISLSLLSQVLRELARQEQASLAASVGSARGRLKVALESTDEGILMVAPDGRSWQSMERFAELVAGSTHACRIGRRQRPARPCPRSVDRSRGFPGQGPETVWQRRRSQRYIAFQGWSRVRPLHAGADGEIAATAASGAFATSPRRIDAAPTGRARGTVPQHLHPGQGGHQPDRRRHAALRRIQRHGLRNPGLFAARSSRAWAYRTSKPI